MADTRVQLIMSVVDRALGPLKRIADGAGGLAGRAKAASDAVKGLNSKVKSIDKFAKVSRDLAVTNNALQTARERTKALAAELRATEQPTDAMRAAFAAARSEAARLKDRQAALTEQQQRLRVALQSAGVPLKGMAEHQANLRTQAAAATAELEKQRAKLTALAKLREQHGRQMARTAMIGGAGMAGMAAGRKGISAALRPVGSYMAHEDAMLGIARQVEGARNARGELTDIYRGTEKDVRALSLEIPLATTAIAEMMTASARMEVPREHLKEQVKLAAEMAIAFDAVPDEIAESMGKVAKNYKMPVTAIRGLADSINYLDDNAISKGSDIIDFLNRTSGVVSTVAMTAPQAAALGSTLLTLGERTETASTAANAIVQKFAAATKGTKKFQSAMKEIGLRSADVQKGMSTDAMGTLFKVVEAIQKLPQDQRIGVMVELVGMEHSDTLAKLVDKPDELRRQMKLATGGAGDGSMAREAAARYGTLSAKLQIAKNRSFNLSAVLGESLRPALENVNDRLSPIIDKIAKWVTENPRLTGGVLATVLVVSALLMGLGALAIAFASVAGPMLIARFLFARLAVGLFGARAAAWGLVPVLRAVAGAAMFVGRAALAFLLTPFGAVLALLAGAAYLVYSRWAEIKAGFFALMRDIGAAIMAGVLAVKSFALQFVQAGGALIDGLIQGITGKLGALKSTIVDAAQGAASWFKEKLGIHSPSRVFMAMDESIPEGAAIGIRRGQPMLAAAALSMAALPALSAPGMGGAGAGMGGPAGGGGTNITITINAAPGQDPQAIARAVAAELDRRANADRRRVRSQNADID